MPTPSSNQPPDQASPPSYAFSTCPDDQPLPPRPARQMTHDTTRPEPSGIEVLGESPPTSIASLATSTAEPPRDGPATDESMFLGGQPSVEPSSRATTVSPRPPSSGTLATSPPDRQDGDDPKMNQDVELNDQRLHAENADTFPREVDSRDWTMHEDEYSSPSLGMDYPNLRTIPALPASYLRPGSRFLGSQQSERQVYEVQVEIKHVDMRESFLCGYLRIQGLTEDHPTLTTYFEGEIIGSKYSFFTEHEDWGANQKVDLSHWAKFSAFRPFQKSARKGPVVIPDVAQRENIFMRWKEHFLVPDHRVRTITGASFEGFYYICFNQLKGEVSGIYFHSKSEKFQQLELKHVPDRGCFSAMEFR